MNGKIDAQGCLQIERGGVMVQQCCPFTADTSGHAVACGHGCPLFGEPQAWNDEKGGKYITICQGKVLFFEQFTDERGAK